MFPLIYSVTGATISLLAFMCNGLQGTTYLIKIENNPFMPRIRSICSKHGMSLFAVPYSTGSSVMRKRTSMPPINENIKADPVRLIVPVENSESMEEEMIGICSLEEALSKSRYFGLDLVLINGNSQPAVCKVTDYGKHKYALEKKQKANSKKHTKIIVKEVKMSYKIDQHDFNVRQRAAHKFISHGDRVKVTVQFKGREIQYQQLGQELLMKLYEAIKDIATVDGPPKREGRVVSLMLRPKQK